MINGTKYIKAGTKTPIIDINEHNVQYTISKISTKKLRNGGLLDCDANGCVFGPICKTSQSVDIGGLDNHQITNIPIGSSGGVISTQKGGVIAIFDEGAQTEEENPFSLVPKWNTQGQGQ